MVEPPGSEASDGVACEASAASTRNPAIEDQSETMSEKQPDSAARPNASDSDGRRGLRGAEAVRLAKEYLHEFTGKSCEQISGLEAIEEGWVVVLELIELKRIPDTADILGSYVVTLDREGELVAYERVERYCRSQLGRNANGSGGEQ